MTRNYTENGLKITVNVTKNANGLFDVIIADDAGNETGLSMISREEVEELTVDELIRCLYDYGA